jgi:myo-inositol 2-dehydrogenase/D-chiro-inositol 1-dehydrogenase
VNSPVRVGVIGVGMIGEDHIRRITEVLSGAVVTAVSDIDTARASAIADKFGGTSAVHASGEEVIADSNVDAVIVASSGPTHAGYVLAGIAAGKPVFCEKPLATTPEDCWKIVEAEVAGGRRLVQVGFMRRYDQAYRALKWAATGGSIGAPLLMHCAHRNPSVPDTVTSHDVLTDSIVHEIDLVRWMFDTEIEAVTVLRSKRSGHAAGDLQDPMMVLLRLVGGVLVDVELSVNIRYGYDIRGEVVGETGVAQLASGTDILVTNSAGQIGSVPPDWRARFSRAYDSEFQEWIDGIAEDGGTSGPSSWDGYAATVGTDACVASYAAGESVQVALRERPAFYAK